MISTAALAGLILQCSGGGVSPDTLQNIIQVESGGNPFAIADVTGKKSFYPASHAAAKAHSLRLSQDGHNYSAGLMQINSANFSAYGLTPETVFTPCKNIAAGADILRQCWIRADAYSSSADRLKASLSCFYSGNFTRGLMKKNGEKISYVDAIAQTQLPQEAIQVPSVEILKTPSETNLTPSGTPAPADAGSGTQPVSSPTPFFTGGDDNMPAWDVFSKPS